jgi:hypothetical protein
MVQTEETFRSGQPVDVKLNLRRKTASLGSLGFGISTYPES